MTKKVILVGGFNEIIEICELSNIKIVGIIDNMPGDHYLGYPILGTDDDAEQIYHTHTDVPVFITPDSPKIRAKLVNLYEGLGFDFISLCHPSAIISKSAKIERGVVIQAGAVVSANSTIGNFVKINTCGTVAHDVKVEDFTTIAPRAVILSHTVIHSSSYIGANATILPNKIVSSGAMIGAGAVVTKDVGSKLTVIGNPANVRKNIS